MAAQPKPPPKQKAIVYMTKHHLYIYIAGGSQVYSLIYPDTAIRDLEVINKDVLFVQIASLIESQKIPPANALIVLSPLVAFVQDFVNKPGEDSEAAIQAFLDNIPFENVASQRLKIKNGVKVIAANREFYEAIESSLKKHGFTIEAAIPFFAAVDKPEAFAQGLTVDLGKMLLQKFDSLKQNTMIAVQETRGEYTAAPEPEEIPLMQNKKFRAFGLFGTFGVLILILIFMVITQLMPQKKTIPPPTAVNTAPPPAAVIPSPSVSVSPSPAEAEVSSASAALEKQKVTIQVLNASGIAGQADLVKKQLNTSGFTNVVTGNSGSNNIKTLIIYTASTSAAMRTAVETEVKKIFPDISVQETPTAQYDVIITTGKISTTPSPAP